MAVGIGAQELRQLFPFHLAFDEALGLRQWGEAMPKLAPGIAEGAGLLDFFQISRPRLSAITADALRQKASNLFMLKELHTGAQFKAQLLSLPSGLLLFVCTPVVHDAAQLTGWGLSLNDFPLYDPTGDLLFMMNAQQKAAEEMRRMNAQLQEQQQVLAEHRDELKAAIEELQASEEEIRQNAEELLAVNERLGEEKKRAEEALTALKETQNQLIQTEKMSSLGQLTAGVAHEINNPVNFISGGTQTLHAIMLDLFALLDGYMALARAESEADRAAAAGMLGKLRQQFGSEEELKQDAEALVDDIEKGVARVVEIVRGLKNFSRSDDHQAVPADLHEMIDASLIILRNQYKDRIEIQQRYDPDLPAVNCFAGQLNQVFLNLIGNAIDAIEGPGHIVISTQNKPQHVEITIQDSGKGIPKGVQSRIFDPFFTTKPIGQGTGLGLSISYGIIEKHRGRIDVASEEGQGATFTIVLPKS
jgi:signal transduction histidine kinase